MADHAAAAGGPWTSHGHPIPGVTVVPADPADRPSLDRCGGPRICRQCAAEAQTIRAEHEGTDTPPPSNRTEPDEEARKHPLHPVIAAALAVPVPGVDRSVRIWGRRTDDAQAGPVGNAWAGTPEDVADHLVRVLLDNLATIDGGRFGLVPTLEGLNRPVPNLTTDPEEADRRLRITLLQRLRDRADAELTPGVVDLPGGDRVEILSAAEVYAWIDGLISRARAGVDL